MFGFIFAVIVSFGLIKTILLYADRLYLLDTPTHRSHHKDITPRGAGIGFMTAFFLTMVFFYFPVFIKHWYIFFSLLLVLIVGIVDDRYEVSAKLKFVVIFIAVIFLWYQGFSIDTIGEWFGHKVVLPSFFALILTMIAIAGFTNALNLIDGLDGLAASLSMVMFLFFFLIGYEHSDVFIENVSLIMIAVLISFLFFNWNPAKIFMGDSGSLSLGFAISVVAVMSIKYIHPVVVLYLTAIPILDTIVVMTRRLRSGASPFSPDKTHVHHILVKFFENDVKKTVVFLTILQIMLSSMGYMLQERINKDIAGVMPFMALIGFGMILILTYMIFTGMKKRQDLLENR